MCVSNFARRSSSQRHAHNPFHASPRACIAMSPPLPPTHTRTHARTHAHMAIGAARALTFCQTVTSIKHHVVQGFLTLLRTAFATASPQFLSFSPLELTSEFLERKDHRIRVNSFICNHHTDHSWFEVPRFPRRALSYSTCLHGVSMPCGGAQAALSKLPESTTSRDRPSVFIIAQSLDCWHWLWYLG